MLDNPLWLRYGRQMLLPEIGLSGQQRLKQSHVLVVGAGGLGCPVLQYLVAAGIGQISLFDDDVIEESNLQRQTLYKINHLGRKKAEVAAQQLYGLNPHVQIRWFTKRCVSNQQQRLLQTVDVVLDCSDNFTTRFDLNLACWKAKKPLVAAAASGWNGQLWVFNFADCTQSGCLRCLFPDGKPLPTQNCQTDGVFGATLGVMGSMQASIATSLLLGQKQGNRFIHYQGGMVQMKHFSILADPDCECYTSG